jgi:hypothetical protein
VSYSRAAQAQGRAGESRLVNSLSRRAGSGSWARPHTSYTNHRSGRVGQDDSSCQNITWLVWFRAAGLGYRGVMSQWSVPGELSETGRSCDSLGTNEHVVPPVLDRWVTSVLKAGWYDQLAGVHPWAARKHLDLRVEGHHSRA